MGTRSLTIVKEEDGNECLVMYRQFDGYPEGHGLALAEFLSNKTIVNGIPFGKDAPDPATLCNGMGCLAAQLVSEFKDGPGGIYLHPSGTRDCWEEYIYKVEDGGGFPVILAYEINHTGNDKLIFAGTAGEFVDWINENSRW